MGERTSRFREVRVVLFFISLEFNLYMGELAKAEPYLEMYKQWYGNRGKYQLWVDVAQSDFYRYQGKYEAIIPLAEQACKNAVHVNETSLEAVLPIEMADAKMIMGKWDESLEMYQTCLSRAVEDSQEFCKQQKMQTKPEEDGILIDQSQLPSALRHS